MLLDGSTFYFLFFFNNPILANIIPIELAIVIPVPIPPAKGIFSVDVF